MTEQKHEGQFLALPNPYAHLDHKGRPAGACPTDAAEHTPYLDPHAQHPTQPRWDKRTFVGARLCEKNTKILRRLGDMLKTTEQDTVWVFDTKKPVLLPETVYYRDRFRDRELFPADEETALALGVKFVSYEEQIKTARAAALADWKAHYPDAPQPAWSKKEHAFERPEAFLDQNSPAEAAKKDAPKEPKKDAPTGDPPSSDPQPTGDAPAAAGQPTPPPAAETGAPKKGPN